MTERVRVREIDDDEGNRLPRIVTPYGDGIGLVVAWQRGKWCCCQLADFLVAAGVGEGVSHESRGTESGGVVSS
ncbi:hypothetical protein ACQP1V_19505 [Microtetraspora malaysiensis]|uniref:hypothetical protein n=1 Tax=Microtetraspora malaysiensis TaxID=161358 RepID=UPI003D8D1E70